MAGAALHGWADRLQQAWLSRGAWACVLWPLSWVYGLAVRVRGLLHRWGWLDSEHLPVPVVVVGNLVAGGAGKTPTVLAIVDLLQRRGFHPGIVSRGYGRSNDGFVDVTPDLSARHCGDEPLLLRLRARVPVVVGRDRVGAGRELLRLHPELDIVVSDDGLQHTRLARDVQVIVFDERGSGNGWLLPAGPLREPVPPALPPRSLVIYNADTATTALPGTLARRELGGAVALAAWWRGERASAATLEALRGRKLIAAAGTARPERFFDMLRTQGLGFESLPLPDHHDYDSLPWSAGTDVIVTEKDAVKLDPARAGNERVWVATLDFGLPAAFDAALAALLPPPPTH